VNRPKHSFLLCFSPKRDPLTATDEEKARKYALAYLSNIKFRFLLKMLLQVIPFVSNMIEPFNSRSVRNLNVPSPRLIIFFASVQKFFITSISEIQKRFSFKDHVFQILPLVKPKNARNLIALHPCLPYSNVFLFSMTIVMLLRQIKNRDLMSI
jgi:hypothetical protein